MGITGQTITTEISEKKGIPKGVFVEGVEGFTGHAGRYPECGRDRGGQQREGGDSKGLPAAA